MESYLADTPGQRAALSGFIGHLRYKHRYAVSLPKPDPEKARQKRGRQLEVEILALMGGSHSDVNFRRRWLSAALAHFHGLPSKVGKLVPNENLLPDGDGITVVWGEERYSIPLPTE